MMNVLLFSPSSLFELTQSLQKIDNINTFFGRSLCVLTENPNVPQEVVLAKVMHLFVNFLKMAEQTEKNKTVLKDFAAYFSSYCDRIKKSHIPAESHYLIDCAKMLIETEVSEYIQGRNQLKEELSILLITDLDGFRGNKGDAMVIHAVNGIGAGIPVIMPYRLLLNIIMASFKPIDNYSNSRNYFENAHQICKDLANSNKWKIYKHDTSDLIVLLPNQSKDLINLTNYQEVKFDIMESLAIETRINWPHQKMQISSQAIIETLSTDVDKHVVWAGHGDLKKSTLGLPFSKVSDVLNQTRKVSCWNLHSCYLLGTIRQVTSTLQNRDSIIVVNNGIVDSNDALMEDEACSAYFLISKYLPNAKDEKIKALFSKFSPWISGLGIGNHPHLILSGSKKIIPLAFPKLTEVLSDSYPQDKIEFEELEQLYIDKMVVPFPISLKGPIAILPGLGEANTHHLLKEVTSNLAFSDFIQSAFTRYKDYLPGNRNPKDRISISAHSGNLLFMIGKLNCADGIFEKIIFIRNPLVNNKILFFKESRWFSLTFMFEPVEFSVEEYLVSALRESCPSLASFEENNMTKESFYEAVADIFNLQRAFEESTETKLSDSEPKESDNLNSSESFEDPFLGPKTFKDKEEISTLYPDIKGALLFCIQTNRQEAFFQILEQHGDLDEKLNYALVLECIKMHRIEMLNSFTYFPALSLRWVALDGTPEMFKIIHAKMKCETPINYQELINFAIKAENWEMTRFLSSKISILAI